MKHRSRVEREENEEKDKKRILAEMEKANQRIKVLERDLAKLGDGKLVVEDITDGDKNDDDDDDDEDDFDDREGLEAELKELKMENEARQKKLDDYEKNKKWNVDNMCEVKEERTIINPTAAERDFTGSGFAKDDIPKTKAAETAKPTSNKDGKKEEEEVKEAKEAPSRVTEAKPTKSKASKPSSNKNEVVAASTTGPVPESSSESYGAMETYHEFTVKHADTVEEFMHLQSFEASKEFLLKHGNVLLQENASNYLLLASLEDEMNGYREKMRLTARQSQIISNIAELAKSLNSHPGNVVVPFFARLDQKPFYDGFMDGVETFVQKIIARAVTKKKEMDRERRQEEEAAASEGVDLASVPKEQRLGPGGLDPLEVIEELPKEMQEAFESRDTLKLRDALLKLEPAEAERLMKRCIASGLWVQG